MSQLQFTCDVLLYAFMILPFLNIVILLFNNFLFQSLDVKKQDINNIYLNVVSKVILFEGINWPRVTHLGSVVNFFNFAV